MQKRPLPFNISDSADAGSNTPTRLNNSHAGQSRPSVSSITLPDLEHMVQGWLLDCEIRQLSRSTLASRRLITDKLIWFLTENHHDVCDTSQLRQFLAYLSRPPAPGVGRWGNENLGAVKAETVRTYHRILRTLFQWGIGEGMLAASPLAPISASVSRPDQVQPFSEAQVTALLEAAKKSHHPKRDEALLLLLLDTGLRASEVCNLRFSDTDLTGKRLVVLGKGNKHRTIFFGRTAAKTCGTKRLRSSSQIGDAPAGSR